MKIKDAYPEPALIKSMHTLVIRYSIVFFILFCLVPSAKLFGQDEYDEVSVFLDISRIGGSELNAIIKGEQLYLPVSDLFDFLKIRNVISPNRIRFRVFLSIRRQLTLLIV